MSSEFIVSICSLIGTALGTFGGMQLTSFRLKQLEERVNKHNSVIERMAVAENRLSVSEHRISDLESEVKQLERCSE